MTRSPRDEEFSAFVQARRVELLRSACLLTAGDTHQAEDLVQTALARLYVAWPRVRRSGKQAIAYTWRIVVHAHIDEVRQAAVEAGAVRGGTAGRLGGGWLRRVR